MIEQGTTSKLKVLISLHKGYGLGDAVKMSAVLRHVVAAHPNWSIDYQAEDGKHQVGRGTVSSTFAYGDKYPSSHYDCEVQMLLYDRWNAWVDKPNTQVAMCLRDRFELDWHEEYGRYQVEVSPSAMMSAETMLYGWRGGVNGKVHRYESRLLRSKRCVALHYQGDSAQNNKNLAHHQAMDICNTIDKLNHEPIVLDWRMKSTIDARKISSPQKWGADAEMVCALIANCNAFIGIDSGPAKCASATNTPSLVVWTGHHPAQFHDPAPNTTHLVPADYHNLRPVYNDPGVVEWFERNYHVRYYKHDPVGEVGAWLREVLR
jgi:hypothetical protein